MVLEKIKYHYNDLGIVPAAISDISSRKEVNTYLEDGSLPVFTAPMSTVVSEKNWNIYHENNIIPIIPRNVDFKTRMGLLKQFQWVAFSLKEIDEFKLMGDGQYKVCVDVANGHMKCLYDKIKELKTKYPNFIIMTGNIANPETYYAISKMNEEFYGTHKVLLVDYLRFNIGSGSGCITSTCCGVHYAPASLIADSLSLKEVYGLKHTPKIIANGGIRGYSDVIKALALGSDYVMIGSLFARCEESSAEKINVLDKKYAVFYGMASRDGQRDLNLNSKTPEGMVKRLEVNNTIPNFSKELHDYMASAMSYCGCKTLGDFIGKQKLVVNSTNSVKSIN